MAHREHSLTTGLRYPHGFPGASEDKRAARLFVYKHALAAPRVGHMVALTGPDPQPEVTLARDYLRWDPRRAWFVDWAKEPTSRAAVKRGLAQIPAWWPGVNALCCDLHSVITQLPLIGFAFLDFMGFTRNNVYPCVQQTIKRLALGGVMAVTWHRGREIVKPHRSAWDVMEAARDVVDLDERRHVGVQRLVEGWGQAQGAPLEWLGGVDYQNKRTPTHGTTMCVMVWRRKSSLR